MTTGDGDGHDVDAGDGDGSDSGGVTGGDGDGGSVTPGDVTTYGAVYEGGEFHLGPVDYAETQWHNACAPGGGYRDEVQTLQGELLAGLWSGIPDVADYCDACIFVTTAMGKSALLRVVTYGATSDNSIDVSPAAYALLDSGEYPRSMTWQLAKCPDTGAVVYEFQDAASEWWTSLWVRNARVPLAKVEVRSLNHPGFTELYRSGDGTLTDDAGFGQDGFTLRLTGIDGSQLTDDFDWPAAGLGGAVLHGSGNFD